MIPDQTIAAPALRYHGAKFRLAPWVLSHFPPHRCYVEPYGGAAGVLLQKPRSYSEVYNDLDADISNFFRVLRDPAQCARLAELCELTPYARDEFDLAWDSTDDPIERARRTVVRAQMGFGSAGATKGTTGFRIDTKREYGTAMDNWLNHANNLRNAGSRFLGVLIENRPAIKVMTDHDAPDTLHFVDPPYVHETRHASFAASRGYRHEMTDADHIDLIEFLHTLKGMVALCGYASPLYAEHLGGWTLHQTTTRAAGNRGAVIRTECLWLNPACEAARRATTRYPALEFA